MSKVTRHDISVKVNKWETWFLNNQIALTTYQWKGAIERYDFNQIEDYHDIQLSVLV
jgi:hypothetical protein